MLRSIAALLLLLGGASTARAQAPTEVQLREGQAHFERGTLAFERGDYGDAAAEFGIFRD